MSAADGAHGITGRIRLQKDVQIPDENGAGSKGNGFWMDEQRKNLQAYEYLCHIGEAKQWLEACTLEEIPPITQLDEALRNGVALAKLAKAFDPDLVRRIFEDPRLQFRHSDNINYFFTFMKKNGLPDLFIFELTDLYDKKNIPKVIYCIHALSHLLAKKGIAPKIKNLLGQLKFTDEELEATQKGLDAAGVSMPAFGNVDKALEKELEPQMSDEEKRKMFFQENEAKIILCQSAVRGALARKSYQQKLQFYQQNAAFITKLQTTVRGHLVRGPIKMRRSKCKAREHNIIKFQAHARGFLVRRQVQAKRNMYKQNEQAVINIQSWFRSKMARNAYDALTGLDSPPVSTLRNFIHLMDDGDQDFEEELELENLKEQVVKQIRDNQNTEQHLSELDIKIALLVKNRISLDEVAKFANKKTKRHSSEDSMKGHAAVFNFKNLDKESRKKLENYQNLFYLLQTQPIYLTRLLWIMRNWASEIVKKLMETCVLTLFSYAQNVREEYLLLKLFKTAINFEIQDIKEIGDFIKGNPAFIKLVVHYNRGARERQYLRDLLQPVLKKVFEADFDLETDPLLVYKSIIREEESKTGQKSAKKFDVSREEALADEATKQKISKVLQHLKLFTDQFMDAIVASLPKMPYGIRYIAKELRKSLTNKFPAEKDETVLRVVGNLVYYRYMNPAIVAPEVFDVIDTVISPLQRKNLSEISKMLNSISVGKTFGDNDPHMTQSNEYISKSSKRFLEFLKNVTTVPEPEEQLNVDEFVDVTKTTKPVIYISPREIFSMHDTLLERLDQVAPEKDDPLRVIITELGPAPPTDQLDQPSLSGEIALTLTNRFAEKSNADVEAKRVFVETKRLILPIIRVLQGKNLLDILEKPVTEKDELAFAEYKLSEPVAKGVPSQNSLVYKSNMSLNTSTSTAVNGDIAHGLNLAALKKLALENMSKLEAMGKVNKANYYQDMLNSIAKDIRDKHRRRQQRRSDLNQIKHTLKHLQEKAGYLDEQTKSFNEYINACIANLTNNKSKQKKNPTLFSRQYFHMRDLKKEGKVPQFGSYKYSAKVLQEKGVLVSIEHEDISPKHYDRINLTISCNEQGVFDIEASYSPGIGVSISSDKTQLKLEELLQYQFSNVQTITLFDIAKVNVNLLLYLINKKFFV
ncbi:hypothetical protein BKA69DRAFT_1080627 [Paraphysoderma sedebokerense]|nr:hypothetical protein BKA69DRAFT_1080627 [Paraphysoderma sedebokerense]